MFDCFRIQSNDYGRKQSQARRTNMQTMTLTKSIKKKRATFFDILMCTKQHDWLEFAVVHVLSIWFDNIRLVSVDRVKRKKSKWPAKNGAMVPFFWNGFASLIIQAKKFY